MKYLLAVLVFVVSLIFFTLIEYGRLTTLITEVAQPAIFALTLALIFLNHKLRKAIFWFSSSLFILMIVAYIFNFLQFANWIGSLAMGIIIVLIASYISNFIKDGYIEEV